MSNPLVDRSTLRPRMALTGLVSSALRARSVTSIFSVRVTVPQLLPWSASVHHAKKKKCVNMPDSVCPRSASTIGCQHLITANRTTASQSRSDDPNLQYESCHVDECRIRFVADTPRKTKEKVGPSMRRRRPSRGCRSFYRTGSRGIFPEAIR